MTADIRAIQIAKLKLDTNNPRLRKSAASQIETLHAIARQQGRKLIALAEDIVEHSMSPADLPIVLESGEDRFVVLEGNRRVATLMVLETPEVLKTILDSSLFQKLKRLSTKYQKAPIQEIDCAVAQDEESAKHWIELRHTGENGGAGLVKWASEETTRFSKRTGTPASTQVLDFLEETGAISADERQSVPVTSLDRLIKTPEVRAKLGIEIENKQVKRVAAKGKVTKALAHVVKDLATGKIKTDDIYTKEKRVKYAKKLPNKVAAPASFSEPRELDGGGKLPRKVTKKKKPKKKVKKRKAREFLIPESCELNVTSARIAEIEGELKELDIEQFTNAASVMLRVFFELSIDAYIDANGMSPANDKLATKCQDVINELVSKSVLTRQQAKPARRACVKNSLLCPSIVLMHEYIHNKHSFPLPSDLRATWDNLQPFFQAIWPA